MSRTRLRRRHGRAALGLAAALLVAACSQDTPDAEEATTPEASAPAAAEATADSDTEQEGGAEQTPETPADGEQLPIESGAAPISPGEEEPEGTELIEETGFSVAVPEGWEDSSGQTQFHYTDPSDENRGVFVETFDGSVEELLPLAAADLQDAGLDPTFYRLDWPGAEDTALIAYDDSEANPPAVHRTYQLIVQSAGRGFWVVAYDEVERFEDSPVVPMLASFRPQE